MTTAMFDETLDDFSLYPLLRIPPLQDPLPAPSAGTGRPSPLEPNARVDTSIAHEAAKLTGRRKALAEAKPIGAPESNDLRPIQVAPRKRRKLYDHERIADFVQLPKPTAKTKEDKPPPFQPISVLNELHEPPPSAALFPPITPSAPQDEQDRRLSTETPDTNVQAKTETKKRKPRERNGSKPPAKRVYLRPRMKWTEDETDQLLKGVAIYGVGKWKKILLHPEFAFQNGRTPVDLKDRFRTRFGPNTSRHNSSTQAGAGISGMHGRRSEGSTATLASSDHLKDSATATSRLHDGLSTYRNTKEKRAKPNPLPPRAWTDAEDADLVKGYQKYGFQWSLVARDPSLTFSNRTGAHVRDRFRLKFPDIYRDVSKTQRDTVAEAKSRKGKGSGKATPKGNEGSAEIADTGREHDENGNDDGLQAHVLSNSMTKQSLSSTAPFNIMGLLNDEEEDNRLSSFRYDDWDENVTLPPLLWEDMATRPMFDLE